MRRVREDTKPAGAALDGRPAPARRLVEPDSAVAAFADDLPDALVVADGEATIRLVNARAAQLLGVTPEAVLGRPVTEVLVLQEESGRSWWDVASPWTGPRTRTGHRERLVTLAGRGPVLVSMQYARPAGSARVSRVMIAMRAAAGGQEWASGQSPAASGQSPAASGEPPAASGEPPAADRCPELLAVAAHELRSPLTSVQGFSATLLRQWDRFTDEQRRVMVATVHADADRLGRLLAELLDVSRLGTQRLTLDVTAFDLRALVEDHLRRLVTSGIDAARFGWAAADAGPGAALVRADRDRVGQIVANLLDNALHHGDGRITLATDTDEPGMVGLSVSDQGPGVDPAHEHDVFTKFWHGRRPGSTGLGLYLVKGLVEAHGGAVTVAPAGGSTGRPGARFRFTLPSGG